MRRAVLTLGGTVAGLAALLSFKTHSLAGVPVIRGTGTSAVSRAPSTAASPSTTRVVTGAAAMTQRGPMQVQLILAGQRIIKVTVPQQTDDGGESMEIDAAAIPQLTSETLAAQSAHIDAVSGATYTSAGYIQSLQSALDKAGA